MNNVIMTQNKALALCLFALSFNVMHAEDYGQTAVTNAEAALQELKTREQEARAQQAAWEVAKIEAETKKIKAEAQARVAEQLARNKSVMSIEDELQKLEQLTEHDLEKTALQHTQAMEKTKLFISSIWDFLGNKKRLTYTTATIGTTALGIYAAKHTTHLAADLAKMWLTKPALVDETSRFHWSRSKWSESFKKFIWGTSNTQENIIIAEPRLSEQMNRIITSTINTKKNNGYYQHLLLYGPPGTGKTLTMRQHAINSGMDYAIMSGANFDRFDNREAQIELNNLFKWAKRSKKGLMIFVDEADAFLPSRQNNSISERSRKLISTFLAETGTENKWFQIALATNHPEILDPAVLDRIDHKIEFALPNIEIRCLLIQEYWNKFVKNSGNSKCSPYDGYDLTNQDIALIAKATEGFSGRGISKLMLSIRAASWAVDKPVFKEMVYDVVREKCAEKNKRASVI